MLAPDGKLILRRLFLCGQVIKDLDHTVTRDILSGHAISFAQLLPRGLASGFTQPSESRWLVGFRVRANEPTAHGTYTHYIITQGASGGYWSPGRPALTGASGF